MMKRIITLLLMLSLVYGYSFAQEKVKSIDDVEIAYTVDGKGDVALVFVHGWSCDKSYWENQVKEFSTSYKVVTIDLAGHGNSGLTRNNYSMNSFGEDVAAVVRHLNLKKVILVGHSMGGPVVIYAANKLRNVVLGIVGADTFQNLGETLPADMVENFLKPFKENFIQTTKGFVLSMFPVNADKKLANKVAEDMSNAPSAVAISAMQNMFADNGTEQLKELSVPIISINCDMYPIKLEQNKSLVKSFEIKMMPGVGHFVMLEDSKKFNELLHQSVIELNK